MNDMTGSDPASVTTQQSDKGRPWLRWVLIGCGGLVALLVAFVVVIFIVVKQATAEPEKVVQTFLNEAGAGNHEAAHDCFSVPLKQAQPLDEFAAGVQANSHLFQVAETSFNERSVDMQGAKLAGTLTLASGTQVPCSFELVRENDQWKLISYNIGSDP